MGQSTCTWDKTKLDKQAHPLKKSLQQCLMLVTGQAGAQEIVKYMHELFMFFFFFIRKRNKYKEQKEWDDTDKAGQY